MCSCGYHFVLMHFHPTARHLAYVALPTKIFCLLEEGGAQRGPPHLYQISAATFTSSSFALLIVSQDLLPLLESKSGATRKMCLSVLAVILEHGGSVCRGTSGPSLAALLHCARSDSEATVRCAAFNCVAEYLGECVCLRSLETFVGLLPETRRKRDVLQ